MDKPIQPKFKYILSPENTYIIDYGDFVYEISGAEIMKRIYDTAILASKSVIDKDNSI